MYANKIKKHVCHIPHERETGGIAYHRSLIYIKNLLYDISKNMRGFFAAGQFDLF